jgi:hypothetical protein
VKTTSILNVQKWLFCDAFLLFVKPTSAAFFRLLLLSLLFPIKVRSSSAPGLVGDVVPYEFVPSANLRTRRNVSIRINHLMLVEYLLEVQRFKVSGGVDNGALVNKQVAVICRRHAFGSHLIIQPFLPQLPPLKPKFLNHFLLCETHIYQIPP